MEKITSLCTFIVRKCTSTAPPPRSAFRTTKSPFQDGVFNLTNPIAYSRIITFLIVMVALAMPTESIAQCESSPAECRPDMVVGHGTDPCNAKVYCSNSGAVESGLINCTNAADTDGCGIDASSDAVADITTIQFANASLSTQALFNGGQCSTGNYLQWIVFATPPTVKGTKIQAVGASDSWWLFHAGSFTSPGDYATVLDALSDPARCANFDAGDLVACSDNNQYEAWVNPNADIGTDVYNVYYIALFYDAPTNGSLNFKVKECEIEDCIPLTTACPDDVIEPSCQTQTDINNSFQTFLDGFVASGNPNQNPVINWYKDGVLQPGKPTVADAPDACGGMVTIKYTISDACNFEVSCERKFTVLPDDTKPVIVDPDDIDITVCNADWPEKVTTTWSDNCTDATGDILEGVAGAVMDGADGCSQYRDYTFNVTDDCGNAADEVTVRVTRPYDKTKPVIVDPDDIDITVCNADWPEKVTTTWSDNCTDATGSILEGVAGAVMDGADGCSQYRDYTFNVTDDCGNAADEVTVRVTRPYDKTKPVIVDPDDIDITVCNADWPEKVTTTWSDNCTDATGDILEGVAGAVMDGADGCSQYRDYTFNVTDDCGNAADEVTVRVTRPYDKTKPVIVDPDDIDITVCNADWPEKVTTTWSDNCTDATGDILEGVAGAVMDGADGCSQYRDYTFNVTDDCGNAADEVTVRVTRPYDKTKPVIVDPDDIDITVCNADWPEKVTTTWSDNCTDATGDILEGVAGAVMDGADGCSQYRDYTFNVTDDCGNAADEVTVRVTRPYDKTKPVIVDPDDIDITVCNADWPEKVTTTWSDNCTDATGDILEGVAGAVMDGADGCSQYRDYTFNVTDDCGNAADEVTVRVTRPYDKTKPVIVDPDDIDITVCNADWPEKVTTTWSDNCTDATGDILEGVAGAVMDGADGCSQYRDYTFNVTDDCGNAADEVTVRVTRPYDKTKPVIVDPDDIDITVCNADWPEKVTTTWSDNCTDATGDILEGVAGAVMDGADGCSQYRDYTFNVTDDCGNAADEVTVRVTRPYDKTKPVIVDPDDIDITVCNADWPEKVTTTWSDNCTDATGDILEGVAGAVMDGADGCSQYRDYTFNVTDDCGNAADEVTVRVTRPYDKTKPVIVDPDDIDITVCNADWPEKVTTTWSDNCTDATGDILEGVAGAVMDGADGCSQYRDYTFNVTDDCGNAADEVTVRVTRPYDKTKPVFNELEDIEVCDGEPIVLPTPVVTDNCSSSGEIVVNNDAPAVFPVGTTTVTWTATDACGNGAQTSIKVTVNPNPSCDIALVEDYGTSLKLGVTGFGGTPGYTYQWLKDGVEIFGETGETIIVSQAGVYSVKITDSKGCSSSCSYTVSQDCGTSWARAQNGSSVCNNTFGCASPNWGWTTQISPSDTPYTFDLLEGAPNECNGNGSTGDLVGTVTVYYNGGTPIVNIETTDGQHFITEWHVHTSCTDPLPTNKKGKCFASPGQFGCAGYENNETQLYNVLDNCRKAASCSGDMWISIHAVTCDLVPEEETLGLSVAKSTAQPFDRPDETIALTTNDTTLEASVPESTIVEAFPLPFENELNVKLSIGYKAQVNVELFDLRGRLIHKSDTYEVSPGVNVLQLPLGRMPSELYIMQVNTGKEILVKKVLSD